MSNRVRSTAEVVASRFLGPSLRIVEAPPRDDLIVWPDIGWAAHLVTGPYGSFEVRLLEIFTEWEQVGNVRTMGPFFEHKDNDGQAVLDPAEGEVVVQAYIKFDGCSNWTWNEDVATHLCGPDDLTNLTTAMQRCYQLARERIDGWCGDD